MMRMVLVLCSALLLLAGCNRQTKTESEGFRPGTAQAEVLSQITNLNGRILRQTTNEVLAEVSPPNIQGPVQVHLTFVDGVLDQVYFLPRRQ